MCCVSGIREKIVKLNGTYLSRTSSLPRLRGRVGVGALRRFNSPQHLSFAPILSFSRRTGEGTLPDIDGLSKRHSR